MQTPFYKRPLVFIPGISIFLLCVLCIGIALLPKKDEVPSTIQQDGRPTSTRTPLSSWTPSPTFLTIISITTPVHCESASIQQADAIRLGIHDISSSNDIGSAWAVRSGDYQNVWFVAAQITGENIEPGQALGLWAISGEVDQPGMVLSANSIAVVFSSWPDGSLTDAHISAIDDGAQEALTCAATYP